MPILFHNFTPLLIINLNVLIFNNIWLMIDCNYNLIEKILKEIFDPCIFQKFSKP